MLWCFGALLREKAEGREGGKDVVYLGFVGKALMGLFVHAVGVEYKVEKWK